ncbi:uncharacterized protein LOC111449272 isoform X1 [Cucurbita moschata]|uniref:Uncharacterized protein LOC111449272 isoform X1 n=1 Tax=Cucurbita moschata TaxID=3662 RepID=A0A6J1FZ96_CUCMO|nr:uncharacterized protein LOC111449272 isoform X1 [Cucurbita moschata]
MPPEPLPWDRKDLFKERKHEKSEAIGSATRWRDSYHGSREFNRWGSADFRRPTGHGKQGGWHQFSEEASHGYGPSRSFSDRVVENESFRPSVPRGDGKYIRIGRESRGSSTYRDWRSYSRETTNGFGNPSRRPSSQDVSSDQRSVDDTATHSSPQSDVVSVSDQIHSKDRNDKVGGACGSENGLRSDVEVSLGSTDWKPLKWSRSGSLSSRASAYSSSTNSKNEKADLPLRVSSLIESSSAEATACVTSSLPFEDTISKKKPRLGWGDGLAKFEKEKVEAPDTSMRKDGTLLSSISAELTHSLGSNFSEKSPKTLPFSDCASPATPSSFACSSSSGLEDKPFSKAASVDGMKCSSPGSGSQNQLQNFFLSLEKLEISSIAKIGSSLVELFQSDDPNTVESCFGKSTLNKLLAYKSDISKTLEMTESEIDLLENELKSLKSKNRGNVSRSKSCSAIYVKESDGVSCISPRPASLKVVSTSDSTVEKMPVCKNVMGVEDVGMKDEEIDSPGTVMSKFNEPTRTEVTDAIVSDKTGRSLSISELFVDERNECIHAKSCTGESMCGDSMAQAASGSSLCDLIFASNKAYASKAAEVIFGSLPAEMFKISSQSTNFVPCSETEKLIKEKFFMRRQFLKFKESALTLRFKALQHSWKEGLLHSVKKCRSKPQKKELSLRVTYSGHQKYRSSIRSRVVQHGACQNRASNSEIATRFSSKLLSNPRVRRYRNILKMPAMILDKNEKTALRFVSNNGLVEDPCAVEKERSMINPWSLAERELFWEKLSLFGKDFRKISSFLSHKTTADCIQFYYKNHKSDSFKKRKNLDLGKQMKSSTMTYMLTSGKKWNPGVNATSLDILGVASVMAAQEDSNIETQLTCARRFDELQSEKETVAADVLVGICGSISSEPMSACITSAIHPGEDYREPKCHKVDSATKLPSTSDAMQRTDNEPCSDDSSGDVDSSSWTDEEKSIFMQAVSSYGKDFDMISRCVGSKSRDQCKVFFSKARKCLGLDLIRTSEDGGTPRSGNDASGSGTDSEAHCVVEGARSSEEIGSKSVDGFCEFGESTAFQQSDAKHAEAVGNLFSETSKEVEEDAPNLDSHSACNLANARASPSQPEPVHDHKIEGSSENTEAGSNRCNEPNVLRSESMSTVDENSTAISESGAITKLAFGEEKGSNSNLHAQSILQCLVQDSSGIDPQISHPNFLKVDSVEESCKLEVRDVPKRPMNRDGYAERENHLSRHVGSSEFPCSHPFNKPIIKDMNRTINHTSFPVVRALSKPDINCNSTYVAEEQECRLQNCNSSKPCHRSAELPFLPPNVEFGHDHRKNTSCSGSASDSDVPCRKGDVKLFGQILSHAPSQQNSSSGSNECGTKKGLHKSSSTYDMGENAPSRSYGFWDGNGLQTGLSAMPDSIVLQAKYPAAFSGYTATSVKTEQQPLLTLTKNDDQAYKTGDGVKKRPYPVDIFSEIHRRNGFDSLSLASLQQQGRMLVGMNVVGRGGILVGNSCTGISDPVAAIKMHYAKADQYVDGSWRGGNGDIGSSR